MQKLATIVKQASKRSRILPFCQQLKIKDRFIRRILPVISVTGKVRLFAYKNVVQPPERVFV